MLVPAQPIDEVARVHALRTLNLLDSEAQERFDRYTRLARRAFGVSIALVSLVDSERQWFLSRQGIDATQTPREVSFCGHVILGPDTFVVPDAQLDHRFADNPLVLGDPYVRFYAGRPLRTPDGHRVGTFCIVDPKPRDMDGEDLALLDDIGIMVEDDMAQRARAMTDALTGISNRRGFVALSDQVLALCRRAGRGAAMCFIDLDGFKGINDTHGHAEGDLVLQQFAALLVQTLRESDVIARLGGDEFGVLMTGAVDIRTVRRRLGGAVKAHNRTSGKPYQLACSVGTMPFRPHSHGSAAELLADADSLMYADKVARRSAAQARASRVNTAFGPGFAGLPMDDLQRN